MKPTLILLTMSLCACSSMTKETYTETRHFHYPKGATPHLKEMYMHKPPTEPVIQQPIIHQEVNTHPEDYSYIAELPEEHRTLAQVREENDLLSALRANKILKQMQ
jgi:hypothetical protein